MKNKDKDSLGNRIKDYELRSKHFVSRKTYTLIRLDGKSFHSFTKGFKRPFDDVLINAMNKTCKYLCENIQGCKLGYVQSDEITLLLTDFEDIKTQLWFDGNIQKMTSISASIATSKFNHIMMLEAIKNNKSIENIKLAQFDSRVFQVHSEAEARNVFLWRQQDATRNSISMVAQSLYSTKELHKINTNQMQELIFQKGINWNDYDIGLKRGRVCYKKHYLLETEKGTTTRSKWVVEGSEIFSSEEGLYFFTNIITPKNNDVRVIIN